MAAAILSLAGTIAAYPFLPATVPLHWDFAGRVDSWGPRWNMLWLGALPLATALLLRLLPRLDPRRASYERHARAYAIIGRLIVLALAAIAWVAILAALGLGLDVGVLVRLLLGLLFVGLGNFMGTLKPNYFVGIKTPWALADDEVWRLTHRRGALVFVALGALFILSLAIPAGRALEALVLASTLGGVAYLYLYSYLCWRRIRRA